jgi:hypothetical protein
VKFKHLVGKSTLKEGITIHKKCESFFQSPTVGDKREITLLFGQNQSTKVTLRKLDNERQHVHIKYNTKSHEAFLNWLNDVFVATSAGRVGEFIEFDKVDIDCYRLNPITIHNACDINLYVAETVEHKIIQNIEQNICFREVENIVQSIKFQTDEGQSYYNKQIENLFTMFGWEKEGRAIPELDLKFDFRKNGIQVEVEFGNARAYYQDYIKFMLSYHTKKIFLGVLVTPTFEFANILCEIGKQKALQKGRKSYSGMMNFDKAYKEFKYLKNIFDVPIVILGIDISSV